MTDKKTVLITGDRGFIGMNLTWQMEGRGWDFVSQRVRSFEGTDDVGMTLDVTNAEAVDEAVFNADLVVHCAAIKGSIACDRSPAQAIATNVHGTINVAEACASHEVKLVHLGTTSYYKTTSLPIDEGSPLQSQTLYGLTKFTAEVELDNIMLAHENGLEYMIVRPVFGYGNAGQFRAGMQEAWPDIILREIEAGRTEPLIINLGGEYVKDWTHITDLVDGIERLATRFLDGEIDTGTIVNLGAGGNYLLNEVIAALKPPFEVICVPGADYKKSQRHMYKYLRDILPGWHPQINVLDWAERKGRIG